MTQYSANPLVKKKPEAPKKGSLITFRKPNSPHLFFKIAGGGTIPKQLMGGFISQTDADMHQERYEASLRKPKKGEVRQESDKIMSHSELAVA